MVADRQPLHAFLDELLAEQGRLHTPVVQASHAHDHYVSGAQRSALNSQLIPLSAPGPNEQYAFEVDLDSCSGCKACVVACHALNGLDETEAWRDVGLVHGGASAAPFQQTVTTACHHCADPGCLNGCPVLAYEKDPSTGIVRHLDDQCIGCQYCILKCPYDVPKYNERLGIVRKCDMCHQRLAVGEAPACAQACPTQAIKIVKVELHLSATPRVDTSSFLAAAPSPTYTQPTTRYRSKQPLPANLTAADEAVLRPQHPHWPLVVMLTLIPASVGIYATAALATFVPGPFVTYYVTNFAWLLGAIGLAASVFHLGQPLRAWRIFLGWRKSWLSREAMVFGAWFGLATPATLLATPWWPAAIPLPITQAQLLFATTLVGVAGLFCSVMIYVDTQRVFWKFESTAPRFFGTALIVGLATLFPRAAAIALLAKLAFESTSLRGASPSARLLRGPLLRFTQLRFALGFVGIAGLVAQILNGNRDLFVTYYITNGLLLAGEIAERYLFFRAVDSPKMPGTVRA